MPQGVEALQVIEARARQLFDWGKRLVDAAYSIRLFNESETNGRCHAELLETCWRPSTQPMIIAPAAATGRDRQSLIVTIAEDHACRGLAPRSTSPIVQGRGVSERTWNTRSRRCWG